MGFRIASKCVCCVNSKCESIDHLFVVSETARTVWRYFAGRFHLPSSPTTINELAEVWLHDISLNNRRDVCRNIIFATSLWEIWKQRNSIIFDNKKSNGLDILCRVTSILQYSVTAHMSGPTQASRSAEAVAGGARWRTPNYGLKLNICAEFGDGNKMAGGGIIRDTAGTMIVAFSKLFEFRNRNYPEFEILEYALGWGASNNVSIQHIESSAKAFCLAFSRPPYGLTYKIGHAKCAISNVVIKWITKEANCVAQALASLALTTEGDQIFSHTGNPPEHIGAAVLNDQRASALT
ncbi:uncharacterized protein M6B38_378590 [Iris pallida]|uniref:RNase H type-1 domain-containing protein n=1 Tax=Iris pallida TaxID=29817 RepID=A0AAX6G8W1_IRIPA|nr:uncharacterized protein M6B38_378590 [Iris pallida]